MDGSTNIFDGNLQGLHRLDPRRFETREILLALAAANRQLAELKGIGSSIPNQKMLINTLGLQEARESSAIENIVTTQEEVMREEVRPSKLAGGPAKEVHRYREALWVGFEAVQKTGLLTNNQILEIQATLEKNRAGFRKLPGTELKNSDGKTVYTPPQEAGEILRLMGELEKLINGELTLEVDPLIKMALIHHQFESIHPFYDGNGRTGRIINVLFLVKEDLLEIPILYLSRYINRNKADYYRLLQSVRRDDAWEDWVVYLLKGVEETARETVKTVGEIRRLLMDYKTKIRENYKFYSQELINNLFTHPYTTVQVLEKELGVSRKTATRYLDDLVVGGFLVKEQLSGGVYYFNLQLVKVLTGELMEGEKEEIGE